jgi:hypothetical protein
VYTGILTAPPQLVRSLSDNKSAHFAADRDPAIDKGPLARSLTNWRGEERDPLTCCSIRARAHCDCCCPCPQRVARNQFIHTVFLSSAVGSFKSPTFGPVARTQERHRHWNALCPLPDANYHPLRSNSQDSVWPGPTTLTGALLLAVTTERERDTTQTLIPIIYLREETRVLAPPQLSLSVAHIRYHRYLDTSHER